MLVLLFRVPRLKGLAYMQLHMDYVFLTLFVLFNGGVTSGLGILFIIMIAASGIIFQRHKLWFFASLSCMLLISQECLLYVFNYPVHWNQLLVHGFAYFVTALMISLIQERTVGSEAYLNQKVIDLKNLQTLNSHIIQKLNSGILVVNADGLIKLINNAARRMLGISHDQHLIGESLFHYAQQLYSQIQRWKTTQINERRAIQLQANSPELVAEYYLLGYGQDEMILVFVDEMSKFAQQAQSMKLSSLGRFTASIAHELRNPLGAISHAAQLLAESSINAEDKRLVDIIRSHSNRMNSVINNVLQLSRRRVTEMKPVYLSEWLDNFVKDFYLEAFQKLEMEVHCEKNLIVFFDPAELYQVISNLCENGIRYSYKKTKQAKLILSANYLEHHQPYLDIIDKGDGVDPKYIDKIFEPFFTTERSGTGMGLYLAKELCEANRARIEYFRSNEQTYFRIIFLGKGSLSA